MDKVVLGRTGLMPTVAGLGCGGHSRLGMNKYGEKHAADIVRHAFDIGVNFFDTAAVYETEKVLGQGLESIPREEYILSSKCLCLDSDGNIRKPKTLMETLENCLRELKIDYVDIYHLHAVTKDHYLEVRDTFVPVLQKAREQGKLRFFGITEDFAEDTSHEMLKLALADRIFEVIMVGYNLLNPSARSTVLPATMQDNVGVLGMFAVRSALSNKQRLRANLEIIKNSGQAGPGFQVSDDILDFLAEDANAESVINAAYRFCRHTKGIDVTLTGTSDKRHLEENLRSINMPALPESVLAQLEELFGRVDCVSAE